MSRNARSFGVNVLKIVKYVQENQNKQTETEADDNSDINRD